MGSKSVLFDVLDHVRAGRLRPVVDRVLPLADAARAGFVAAMNDELGAIEWATTLIGLVQMRLAQDQPATRMAIILGVVVMVTAASALLFETQTMKRIYKRQ